MATDARAELGSLQSNHQELQEERAALQARLDEERAQRAALERRHEAELSAAMGAGDGAVPICIKDAINIINNIYAFSADPFAL